MEKIKLLERLATLNPLTDKVILDPLKIFIEMSPYQREVWCHDMQTGNNVDQMTFMLDSLEKLRCSSVRNVDFWDAFKERLRENSKIKNAEIICLDFAIFWEKMVRRALKFCKVERRCPKFYPGKLDNQLE